jgi:hypothetical protein
LDTLNSYSGIKKLSFAGSNHFYVSGISGSGYSFLARINKTTGMLDIGFGNNGVQKVSVDGYPANSSAVQGDGKPLFVSVFRNSSNKLDFHLIRTDLNGNLDNTFGTAGEVKTSFFDNDFPNYMIYDYTNNKIIVLGHADGTSVQGIIMRYIGGKISNFNPTQPGLNDIKLYPNPVIRNFFISGLHANGLTDLKIYNMSGQSVYFESNMSDEEIQIRFPAGDGIYVLRGFLNGKEFTRRFVRIGE